jgi:hypothetical protein
MSIAVGSYRINQFVIQTLDGKNSIDVSNSLLFFNYFEDLLSPCVTGDAKLINSSSLFNILRIRGGEKVSISLSTISGDFVLDETFSLYVSKVTNLDAQHSNETFTIHLVSREGLTNETSRCEKRYIGNFKNTVTDILQNVLVTDKYQDKNIEKTSNDYSFIGNNKKPFHTLIWLCPKAVPITFQNSGLSGGGEYGEARGTSGFLFYENREGFNFRSVDSLVSNTKIEVGSSDKKNIPTYTYTQVIEHNKTSNRFMIHNYNFQNSADLMKSLRVGMYANKTYFYDLYSNTVNTYTYKLNEQIQNKLGSEDKIAVSDEFGNTFTRIMVRASDRGLPNSDGTVNATDSSGANMSMAYSRYNLLFSQSLNMVVPCNVELKVGDIIRCEFQRIDRTRNTEVDPEQSGFYLIKELRHHFEGGQTTTSLGLIRDSYGLYGSKNA